MRVAWGRDVEQLIDVDLLDREAAAHDVVAGPHQLDPGAAEVGVKVPGSQVDRLARLQRDAIEQQRDDGARSPG